MAFEYVREHYDVPAEAGRRVVVDGDPGVIAKDCGHYIGVSFDRDRPGIIKRCHPTWRVQYLGMGRIRQMTRSQARYNRYLEYGDGFDNFRHFLAWDADPTHAWNAGARA